MRKISFVLIAAMILSLAGCTQTGQTAPETPAPTVTEGATTEAGTEEQAGGYTAGTYEGTFPGRNGDVTVSVTVSDTEIKAVEIKEHMETDGVADLALTQIPQDIVTYQSLGVDAITGATFTSNAVIRAAAEALKLAGGNVDALYDVPVNKELAPVKDISTQIVIAGGGIAGVSTACSAVENGLSVSVLEKNAKAHAFGLDFGCINSSLAKEYGIPEYTDDEIYRMTRRWVAESSGRTKPSFVLQFLKNTGRSVDWVTEKAVNWGCTPVIAAYSGNSDTYENAKGIMEFHDGPTYGQGESFGVPDVVDVMTQQLKDQPLMLLPFTYPYFYLHVNKNADRFMNEDSNSVGMSVGQLMQPNGIAWSIWDSKWPKEIPASLEFGGGMDWDQDFRIMGDDWSEEAEQATMQYNVDTGNLFYLRYH